MNIKKISICLSRGREESVGNDDVSIVCARKYEMVRMTSEDRTSPRDRLGRFCEFIVQSFFDTLLRYVLSVTFCGAVVSVKVMDQNFNDTR